jgi:hypothetical protein
MSAASAEANPTLPNATAPSAAAIHDLMMTRMALLSVPSGPVPTASALDAHDAAKLERPNGISLQLRQQTFMLLRLTSVIVGIVREDERKRPCALAIHYLRDGSCEVEAVAKLMDAQDIGRLRPCFAGRALA